MVGCWYEERKKICGDEPLTPLSAPEKDRMRKIELRGRVQGVGFRPFVYQLAQNLKLRGCVWNSTGRVQIIVVGNEKKLDRFEERLITDAPHLSHPTIIRSISTNEFVDYYNSFSIAPSHNENPDIFVPPDVGLCLDCFKEFNDKNNRRYLYPFINCTQCGPRFTIIKTMPYDRLQTSMAPFTLCVACEHEYQDPSSRRFHAEAICCPNCGPQLYSESHSSSAALYEAGQKLKAGFILAIKGIGGYHLVCDACNDEAVDRLRRLKNRPAKPLAIMVEETGVDGLEHIRHYAYTTPLQSQVLRSQERPIVLLPSRRSSSLSKQIAPGLAEIGVVLPYTAIHIFLLKVVDGPLVVTSGNPSGEPLATTEEAATSQLHMITDMFIHSNRKIIRRADDSVVKEIAGQIIPLRIGRGLGPVEIDTEQEFAEPILAVGGHKKNAIAIGWGRRIVLSPHVGDLDSPASLAAFQDRIRELSELYQVSPRKVLCDAHPQYTSHLWAQQSNLKVEMIYHHRAHAAAAINPLAHHEKHLVFTWDGVGLGEDNTLWGGEAFYGRPGHWQRILSLRPLRIPGAVHSGRESWRSRAGIAFALQQDPGSVVKDRDFLFQAWERQVGCYETSAVGRLFDAAASWILDRNHYDYEAQGPQELETLAQSSMDHAEELILPVYSDTFGLRRIDYAPLISIVSNQNIPASLRAAIFHKSLIATCVHFVVAERQHRGSFTVNFGGGVFANKLLTEGIWERLQKENIKTYVSPKIPLGDGGIAYGQLIEYLGKQS